MTTSNKCWTKWGFSRCLKGYKIKWWGEGDSQLSPSLHSLLDWLVQKLQDGFQLKTWREKEERTAEDLYKGTVGQPSFKMGNRTLLWTTTWSRCLSSCYSAEKSNYSSRPMIQSCTNVPFLVTASCRAGTHSISLYTACSTCSLAVTAALLKHDMKVLLLSAFYSRLGYFRQISLGMSFINPKQNLA